jgi:hypothetical protein
MIAAGMALQREASANATEDYPGVAKVVSPAQPGRNQIQEPR